MILYQKSSMTLCKHPARPGQPSPGTQLPPWERPLQLCLGSLVSCGLPIYPLSVIRVGTAQHFQKLQVQPGKKGLSAASPSVQCAQLPRREASGPPGGRRRLFGPPSGPRGAPCPRETEGLALRRHPLPHAPTLQRPWPPGSHQRPASTSRHLLYNFLLPNSRSPEGSDFN